MLKPSLLKESVVTAVDASHAWLKVAQAVHTPKGKKIAQVFWEPIEGKKKSEIVQILRNIISRLKIKPASLVTIFPLHNAIVRFIQLPTVKEAEIGGMLEYQITKVSPYPKEEVIFDYRVVEIDKQGYSQVMLAIAHRDAINAQLDILKTANLKIQQIALSSEASAWWYKLNREPAAKAETPVALVDIDALNTDIMVSSGDKIIFSRGIVLGADNLSKNPAAEAGLLEELSRSFISYNKLYPERKVKKIILSGGLTDTESLKTKLFEKFACEVEAMPIFKRIFVDKAILEKTKAVKLSLSAIIGLALGSERIRPNLLPPMLKKQYQVQFRTKRLISNISLLVLVLLLGVFIFLKSTYNKGEYLKFLDRRIQETSPEANEIKIMANKNRLIRKRLESRGLNIKAITELYKIMPEEIFLTDLNLEKNTALKIKGISSDMSRAYDFVSILENSAYFKNVEVKYTRQRKSTTGQLTDFQIQCLVDSKIQ